MDKVFVQAIPHLIVNLVNLVNEMHKDFEDPKSLEVRAVFLDIPKAVDKVWHDGLIFKVKQNGTSGGFVRESSLKIIYIKENNVWYLRFSTPIIL